MHLLRVEHSHSENTGCFYMSQIPVFWEIMQTTALNKTYTLLHCKKKVYLLYFLNLSCGKNMQKVEETCKNLKQNFV
jgi:hypothetical protein